MRGEQYAFQFYDFFMVVFTGRFYCKPMDENQTAESVSACGQSVFLCLGRTNICAFDVVLHFFELELRHAVGTVPIGQAFDSLDRYVIESVIAGVL